MAEFATTPPIPYVPIADKAAEVRLAIDAARLSAANSFGGLQKLAIPGPFATDAEASTGGVPDDNLYYRSDGTVRAASHISLDLAFALDKTLTARTGPTPTFSRASSGLFVNANGILVGKTAGTTVSLDPTTTTVGATEVTVTVASGSVVGWLVGQSVSLIVDSNANNAPDTGELWLVGDIVSMTATQLVFKVTSKGTTSASATVWTLGYRGARFDHDPTTGESKGLLIEEPRSNLLRESQALDNSAFWAGASAGLAVTPNNQISPDGLSNAETINISNFIAQGFFQPVTCTANTVYTFSFYVKLGTFLASNFLIAVRDDVGNAFIAENVVPSVTPVTGEWRRITYTFTTPTNCTTVRPYVYRNNSPSTTGTFYIWGAQLEAGAFPTSYIPTTIGTAARGADVCSIVNTSPFWNQSEFTVLSQANFANPLHDAYSLNFSPEFFGHRRPNNNGLMAIIRNLSANADIQLGTLVTGAVKIASAHIAGQQSATVNGASVTSRSTAYVAEASPTLHIGFSGVGISQLNGHIARIQYFRKRFSNAKLQTLTTP